MMDYAKFIVSNQNEASSSTQRVIFLYFILTWTLNGMPSLVVIAYFAYDDVICPCHHLKIGIVR